MGTASIETFSGRLNEEKIKAIRITMIKRQLQEVMEQLGCERVEDFPKHLVV